MTQERDTSTLAARLKIVRGSKTQEQFAELLGLNINTLRGYEKGLRTPGADTISALCQKTGASPTWMLLGEGPVFDPERTRYEPTPVGQLRCGEPLGRIVATDRTAQGHGPVEVDGLLMVPKVTARLSAGSGSFETDAEVKGLYAFRAEWLRAKGNPDKMVLMEVSGDSMEPMLRNGDTVLIDKGQDDVVPGKVYAVGIEDTVVVKEVERLPGKLVLRSSNPAYPPVEIAMQGDLADGVRVIGRVIWWCHEAL